MLAVVVMIHYLDDPCCCLSLVTYNSLFLIYVLCLCYMFFMSATLLIVLLPMSWPGHSWKRDF